MQMLSALKKLEVHPLFCHPWCIDFFISDEQIDLEKQELFREGKSEGKHKIDRGSPASVGRLNNSERNVTKEQNTKERKKELEY